MRKVVRDCKNAYTQSKDSAEKAKAAKSKLPPQSLGDLSGGNFAEALRKAVNKDEDDTDLDLNIDGVDSSRVEFGINAPMPSFANPATAVDLAMLRQPLHLTFLQYGGQQTLSSSPPAVVSAQLALPANHSSLSRVVVNAIGRLGRWRRVLNYRTTSARAPMRPPIGLGAACMDATSFDLEASETGDLLLVKGGVEQYLKMVETQMSARKARHMLRTPRMVDPPPPYDMATKHHLSAISQQDTLVESLEPVREASDEGAPTEDEPPTPEPAAEQAPEPVTSNSEIEPTTPSARAQSPPAASFRSSMQPSMRSSIMSDDTSVEFSGHQRWRSRFHNDRMNVVSIDDLDSLSDFSSEAGDPREPLPQSAGLRRHPRRLPNRRDFEFVRRSVDSTSSMGIRTHDSVLSAGSSAVSSAHVSGSADFAGPIQQWQMNALVDSLSDEEEAGDVEAALRRLEGQISQDKQRLKQTKVDGWVQSIRDRLANGQFGSERRRFSSDDEEDYGEVQSSMNGQGEGSNAAASQRSVSRSSASRISSSRNSVGSAHYKSPFAVTHPSAEERKASTAPPGHGHSGPVPSVDGKPAPEDVVPIEILQSRVSSRPTTSAGSPPAERPPPPPRKPLALPPDANAFVKEKSLTRHRSFVLGYKSETLMHHFTMIDRELFLGLKFEELVSQSDWMKPSEEYNVLDWSQFMKDRKMKSGDPSALKTSGLTAIRSRFNIMANFVIAEIIITHPSERLMVFSKFVRIAWVSAQLCGLRARH